MAEDTVDEINGSPGAGWGPDKTSWLASAKHTLPTPLWTVLSQRQLPLFSFTLGPAAPEPVIINEDLSGDYMVLHLAFDNLTCQGVEFRWFGWAQTRPAVMVPAVLQLCTSFQM